jgi:twitching motility protein PilT
MAHLDRFVKALYRNDAERLLVVPGEKVTLVVAGRPQPISSKPATTGQVNVLLREVLPTGQAPERENGAEHYEFSYASPSGLVRVHAARSADRTTLQVERAEVESRKTAQSNRVDARSTAADGAGGGAAAGPLRAAATGGTGSAAADAPSGGLEDLLRRTVEEDCSDLHLSAGNLPLFRKDGSIVTFDGYEALSPEQVREMVLAITPPRNRQEFEDRHDTDFAHEIRDLARFRVNLFMDRKGPGGVFRVIPSEIQTVQNLGLPEHILHLCRLTKGLVLVTGPTGSGKSTTLAAMLDYVNRSRSDHVITIEDPIEFVHENKKCLINQREVGVHTDSFKIALRAALREDPDIVLVGELRDLETVEIALETAETGHLVFGTLHTTTAAATVDRIIDQFPTSQQNQIRTLLADTLKGVISQTLCRRKGGGRVAALEILMVTAAVANLIREGKTYQIPTAMQTGRSTGMQTLNSVLVDLVKSGVVDAMEAYARAVDKTDLKSALARAGVEVDLSRVPDAEG